jgi:uncharacterized protein (TIGR00369 family)
VTNVPIWQEPVRGGYPDFRYFGVSGLDQLRTFFKNRGPRPPISHLLGIWFEQVAEGTATFSIPASGWLLSPAGVIPGGVLAMLADAPLGCAVQTALPPATAYTTAEISMTFLRPATTASGKITAHGQLIHAGRSLALSEVFILDEQEQMLAHGTSRCYVFPPLDSPPEPPPEDFVPEIPTYDTPDPYERPVQGEILPENVWGEMSGLELMKGWVAWDLPAPPLYYLTGSRPTEADEGTATQVLPASRWLDSPLGRIQGGAEAFVAELAIQGAVLTTVPAGTAFAPLDMKINFFRPTESDGRDLVARAKVDHRGRTLATATCDLFDADGKRLASAVGTSMLLPGRTYSLAKPVVQTEEATEEEAVAKA